MAARRTLDFTMRLSWPCIAILLFGQLAGIVAQENALDQIKGEALDLVTNVQSILTRDPSESNTSSRSSRSSRSTPTTSAARRSSATSDSTKPTRTTDASSPPSATDSSAPSDPRAASDASLAEASDPAETAAEVEPVPAEEDEGSDNTLPIALGVVIGLLAVGISLGVLFCCWRRRQRRKHEKLQGSPSSPHPKAIESGHFGKGYSSGSSTAESELPAHSVNHDLNHASNRGGMAPISEDVTNTKNVHHHSSTLGSSLSHDSPPSFHSGTTSTNNAPYHGPDDVPSYTPVQSGSIASKLGAAGAGLGVGALAGSAVHNHHRNDHIDHHGDHHTTNKRNVSRKPVHGRDGPPSINRPSSSTASHSGKDLSDSEVLSHGPNNSSELPVTPRAPSRRQSVSPEAATADVDQHHQQPNFETDVNSRNSPRAERNHLQHPSSIIANVAGRRHSGSTNSYVLPSGGTGPGGNTAIAEMSAARIDDDDRAINQKGWKDNSDRPPVSPLCKEDFERPRSHSHVPGSWGGSCDWNSNNRQGSFSGHDDGATSRPRSQSLKDTQQQQQQQQQQQEQQEENAWYRSRQMSSGGGGGGSRWLGFPHRPRYDRRFYAGKGGS